MEKTDMNVQDVVKQAVELEKTKQELIEAKANVKLYETLYNEAKTKAEKNKQIEVRVTQPSTNYDGWGYKTTNKTVEMFSGDADDVTSRIKKLIDKTSEENLENKEKKIKQLQKELNEYKDSFESDIQKHEKYYNKLAEKNREEYNEKREKLSKQLADLKEELEKVKTNKTDAELEKKRKEEIADLKVRIRDLEAEVKNLLGLSWIKRLWYKMTTMRARVEAQIKVVQAEENADSILRRESRYAW